jgi:hypothetical protein
MGVFWGQITTALGAFGKTGEGIATFRHDDASCETSAIGF